MRRYSNGLLVTSVLAAVVPLLFLFQNFTAAPSTVGAKILMDAVVPVGGGSFAGLGLAVPAYFAVLDNKGQPVPPISSPVGWPGAPALAHHAGMDSITYQAADPTALANAYLGLYIPAEMSASYRVLWMTQDSQGNCQKYANNVITDWEPYGGNGISGSESDGNKYALQTGNQYPVSQPATSVSVLANIIGPNFRPQGLLPSDCILVQWQVQPVSTASSTLLEVPSSAQSGVAYLPATKTLDLAATAGVLDDAPEVRVDLAEDFGAVVKDLQIRSGSRPFISILNNHGAPTDDGLMWGIEIFGVTGLLADTSPAVTMATQAFAGHSNPGVLGDMMWGMREPLAPVSGNANVLSAAGSCVTGPCWIPMYTDFWNDSTTASLTFSANGTFPFLFPSSLHPWDGQVSEFSLRQQTPTDGVVHFTYSYKYRPHDAFTASGEPSVQPHVWFNQILSENDIGSPSSDRQDPYPTNRPMSITLVFDRFASGGSPTTSLSFANLQLDPTGFDAQGNLIQGSNYPAAEAAWDAFCQGDSYSVSSGGVAPGPRCALNSDHGGNFTCRCNYSGNTPNTVKHVIYNYGTANVAVQLEGLNTFGRFEIGSTWLHKMGGLVEPYLLIPQYLLTSAGNENLSGIQTFSPANAPLIDTYFFNVGTYDNLIRWNQVTP